MKMYSIVIAFFFLLFLVGLPDAHQIAAQSQEPFNSYGHDISWELEITHLDDFSIYLKKNPDAIGYICYFVGDKERPEKVRRRVRRAKDYLHANRNIEKGRVKITYAGRLDNSRTALYLIEKDSPSPPCGEK